MKMKTLALLSLSLAVALGMPPFAPGVVQNPAFAEKDLNPLLGDWVPLQGHVVAEDPAPQVGPSSEEEELAPVPVDMKQSRVEIKVKPQVGEEEQEGGVKTEVKKEPEVKPEADVKAEPEVEVDLEADVKPDVEEELHVQMNLKAETETGREIEERHIDMEGKYEMVGEPIMELEPLDGDNRELSEGEKSLKKDPPVEKGELLMSEMDYELDKEPIMELEPLDDDNTELSEGEKSLRKDPPVEKGELLMSEMDYELDKEPIMELEPLDDDNTELSDVEKSMRAAFQNQDPAIQHLPEEDEGLIRERSYVLDGEPIMELEPLDGDNRELSEGEKSLRKDPPVEKGELLMSEMDYELDKEPIMELEPLDDDNMELSEVEKSMRAAFQNQDPAIQHLPEEDEGLMREMDHEDEEPVMDHEAMPDAAIMDEGPALDFMGQQIQSLEHYFPNEEGRMGVERGKQLDSLTAEGSDYLMMEEPEEAEPKREKRALMRQGVKNPEERRSPNQYKEGKSHCPGVILEGKCYQFFRGPKRAADAEFYCQEQFAGGHLASITSPLIHREVMNMMLRQNGAYTRTWIGGLRYLETGRFIWLDGSRWTYADWLSGEPNNTADVEDCVEVLALGNGKFNDFTCWEPQAFICSYPYQ